MISSCCRSTTADFADDALAGVRFLRSRPEIAPGRIGLIGHSEGGIVAPLAATRAPDEVAFLVLLAG
ncbi:MAG: alpha/beta hydrolase family protein, partial [Candidatus Krumholzibacteriia bacterium]